MRTPARFESSTHCGHSGSPWPAARLSIPTRTESVSPESQKDLALKSLSSVEPQLVISIPQLATRPAMRLAREPETRCRARRWFLLARLRVIVSLRHRVVRVLRPEYIPSRRRFDLHP